MVSEAEAQLGLTQRASRPYGLRAPNRSDQKQQTSITYSQCLPVHYIFVGNEAPPPCIVTMAELQLQDLALDREFLNPHFASWRLRDFAGASRLEASTPGPVARLKSSALDYLHTRAFALRNHLLHSAGRLFLVTQQHGAGHEATGGRGGGGGSAAGPGGGDGSRLTGQLDVYEVTAGQPTDEDMGLRTLHVAGAPTDLGTTEHNVAC